MRGEKFDPSNTAFARKGSPPRARGKGFAGRVRPFRLGITPACAGKSRASIAKSYPLGDHPRVRGEKTMRRVIRGVDKGSPPRARGKGLSETGNRGAGGITPACAGKSVYTVHILLHIWDHPRVRGEKSSGSTPIFASAGSPPRARGKGQGVNLEFDAIRITPACAGKSTTVAAELAELRDHPRVRGEKFSSCSMR